MNPQQLIQSVVDQMGSSWWANKITENLNLNIAFFVACLALLVFLLSIGILFTGRKLRSNDYTKGEDLGFAWMFIMCGVVLLFVGVVFSAQTILQPEFETYKSFIDKAAGLLK